MPTGERAPLEMIEAELGLELLILLLDGPAVMRQADDLDQRRGRGQMDEIVFGARRGADIALGEEPDFGHQPPVPAVDGGRDADRHAVDRPGPRVGPIAPAHAAPAGPGRDEGLAERTRRGAPGQRRMFARPSTRRRAARLQARGAEKDREMRQSPARRAAAADATGRETRDCRQIPRRPAPRSR